MFPIALENNSKKHSSVCPRFCSAIETRREFSVGYFMIENKLLMICITVEPRCNEALYNEVLSITNDVQQFGQSYMH